MADKIALVPAIPRRVESEIAVIAAMKSIGGYCAGLCKNVATCVGSRAGISTIQSVNAASQKMPIDCGPRSKRRAPSSRAR